MVEMDKGTYILDNALQNNIDLQNIHDFYKSITSIPEELLKDNNSDESAIHEAQKECLEKLQEKFHDHVNDIFGLEPKLEKESMKKPDVEPLKGLSLDEEKPNRIEIPPVIAQVIYGKWKTELTNVDLDSRFLALMEIIANEVLQERGFGHLRVRVPLNQTILAGQSVGFIVQDVIKKQQTKYFGKSS